MKQRVWYTSVDAVELCPLETYLLDQGRTLVTIFYCSDFSFDIFYYDKYIIFIR